MIKAISRKAYKIIQLVGSSPSSVEDATQNAITRAYFDVSTPATDAAFLDEVPRHPAFRLRPTNEATQ